MLLLGFAKHHHGLHIDLLARLVYVMYDGFAGFVPVEESACPVFVFQRFRALSVEGVADVTVFGRLDELVEAIFFELLHSKSEIFFGHAQ